jgi:hypothetical protein
MIKTPKEAFEQIEKCKFRDELGYRIELNLGYIFLKDFISELEKDIFNKP